METLQDLIGIVVFFVIICILIKRRYAHMASIVKRNNTYSVVYYYRTETGKKKQKWETYKSYDDAFKRKQYLDQSTSDSLFKTITTFEDLVTE